MSHNLNPMSPTLLEDFARKRTSAITTDTRLAHRRPNKTAFPRAGNRRARLSQVAKESGRSAPISNQRIGKNVRFTRFGRTILETIHEMDKKKLLTSDQQKITLIKYSQLLKEKFGDRIYPMSTSGSMSTFIWRRARPTTAPTFSESN